MIIYDEKEKNFFKILFLIFILLLMISILADRIGSLEHNNYLVPTGNVDIFDITCENNCCNDDEKNTDVPVFNEEDGLLVYDKYTIYNTSNLRIFENPAYQYQSIIAPGTSNSYNFVIRNNNKFNVIVDINMSEINKYNIPLKFRLKENGSYIIGNSDSWVSIDELNLKKIKLNTKQYNTYTLDWKWEFSESDERDKEDTKIGFNATENYKLFINIKSSEK